MRAWLIGWLIFTVGVGFYLSNRGLATCSSWSYWNNACDSLTSWGSDLHCRQFWLLRDIELCPGNTLPRTNVVGSPRSYPFLSVVKVADKAHFLPLETLIGWNIGRTAQLHSYATHTPGRLDSFLHLCSSLNVVSRIQIFRHVRLYSGRLAIASALSSLWLRKVNPRDLKVMTVGNLTSYNQGLRAVITSSIVVSNIYSLQFWHDSLELTEDVIKYG